MIPDSVISIGNNAFMAVINMTVNPGSYAEQYCIENGLLYTYPEGNLDWLRN